MDVSTIVKTRGVGESSCAFRFVIDSVDADKFCHVYKRDNEFFNLYHQNSRERDGFLEWLEEWVLKPKEHVDYLKKLGKLIETLKIKDNALSVPANYATK